MFPRRMKAGETSENVKERLRDASVSEPEIRQRTQGEAQAQDEEEPTATIMPVPALHKPSFLCCKTTE